MPNYSSKDVAFFLIGGYSLLGTTTTINDDGVVAKLQETTPLGVRFPEFGDPGGRSWKLSQSGLFNDAAGSINDAICGKQHLSRVLSFGLEGNTIGRRFLGASGAFAGKYARGIVVDKFHTAKADYQISAAYDEGRILHALGAETAAGNTEGTSVDNAASSAAGGAGYLQVSALTLGGYTSATVKIRHSVDNVTFADLITFTAATAAPTAERKTVAGTVNRYLATSWLFNGAGAGPSITFMAGFARG